MINNTMKNNQTGLFLAWSVIGHQGSVGNPRDNKWLGSTWNSSNPHSFVESRNGDDSRFYVRTSPAPDYIPTENDWGGSGSALGVYQTSGSWSGGCVYTDGASFKTEGAQSSNETLTSLLSAAASEEVETERERSQHYTGLYNIYNRLLADPELSASEPTLEAFFAESNDGNMGVLRRTIAGFSAATKGAADATTLTALQALQPENLVEQTLKDVFGTLYSNATGLTEMNEEDETQLRKIAQLCPIDYGFGVFTARAALVSLDTLPKHYISECEREMSPEEMRDKTERLHANRGFSVYPNPSQGLLTVNYELEQGETGQVLVLDITGKQIRRVALDATGTTIALELRDISSGLYLVQLGINGDITDSERVSILKP